MLEHIRGWFSLKAIIPPNHMMKILAQPKGLKDLLTEVLWAIRTHAQAISMCAEGVEEGVGAWVELGVREWMC